MISLPLAIFLNNSQLFPLIDLQGYLAHFLYSITWTGTIPFGIAFILFILGLCYQQLPKKIFLQLFIAVLISQSAGVILNKGLKNIFHEIRPNIQWLDSYSLLDKGTFYSQDKSQRRQILKNAISNSNNRLPMSESIAKHWIKEVGYSFPSGHTQFAVSFVLIVSFYLLACGGFILPVLLLAWGLLMELSRMLLGLHWSQDVLASAIIGGAIAFLTIGASYFFHQKR